MHPTFLYESIWCLVGLRCCTSYLKKRKFNGDITLRYLIWYGAGRFWIEALRTDSLMLVPSIGLRVSQLVAGCGRSGRCGAGNLLDPQIKGQTAHGAAGPDGREPQPAGEGAQGRSWRPGIFVSRWSGACPEGRAGGFQPPDAELKIGIDRRRADKRPGGSSERTNAYNERVKQQLKEKLAEKN